MDTHYKICDCCGKPKDLNAGPSFGMFRRKWHQLELADPEKKNTTPNTSTYDFCSEDCIKQYLALTPEQRLANAGLIRETVKVGVRDE